MKITEVKVRPIAVPLEEDVCFSRRIVKERHYALVRICTDQEIEGIGVCYCGHKGSKLVASAVDEFFSGFIKGQDPRDVQRLWEEMYHESFLLGRRGAVLRGLSAIDIALWDIKTKEANLPLYKYLGASKEQVPAYASGGYYFSGGLKGLEKEIVSYVEAGYQAIKIKVGRIDLVNDVQRVKLVREILGPDHVLLLDANNAWSNLQTAWIAMQAFEEFSPAWIEEPFYPDDVARHRELKSRIKTPVATGEHGGTHWEFDRFLEARAVDIIQPDAGNCGGITEWLRIVNSALSYGIDVSPHSFRDIHVQLACAVPNVTYIEYFTGDNISNMTKLLQTTIQVKEGIAKPLNESGVGLVWDWEAVEKYALSNWI